MRGLDLFTGIGGITLALQDWVKPIAYCEIDSYCQSVLLQRMQEGFLPKAPIWDDIRTLPTNELPGVDIIYGGFPCQDISIAGRQEGLEGKRSGLFFEILRLLDETKAPFVFLENVPNIRTKGAERVCKELAERGYDCRWCNISARDVGVRHKRERWFLLAHTNSGECGESLSTGIGKEKIEKISDREKECPLRIVGRTSEVWPSNKNNVSHASRLRTNPLLKGLREEFASSNKDVAYTEQPRQHTKHEHQERSATGCGRFEQGNRTAQPDLCRTPDDVSEELDTVEKTTTETKNRANRIKALGNSVVPLQVKTAFKILTMNNINI